MKPRETQIRVRYQETDNMGVVYYGNYFTYFEVARTEYLRSFGIAYRDLEKKGVYLLVASASCNYKSPARYDDALTAKTWISEMKNTSLKFEYKLCVADRLIATGESVHVFTDRSFKPLRIPDEIKKIIPLRPSPEKHG
jgi:acyl-CoA thioester hydrolase